MWVRLYPSQFQFILLSAFVLAPMFSAPETFAQEGEAGTVVEKSARERELRERLQKILHELEELQQQPPSGASAVPVQPAVVQESPESPLAEPIPHYELADVSIVSERVQRRPEGVSLSATQPSETDSQPTRTMKESMESLPGVVLRQANGPRDFSIMIRGQGAKTAFAVRDIKIYEDGFMQTQSDGLSRLDIQDPWFMRSVEVTRGASSSLYDNYALGGMVQFVPGAAATSMEWKRSCPAVPMGTTKKPWPSVSKPSKLDLVDVCEQGGGGRLHPEQQL